MRTVYALVVLLSIAFLTIGSRSSVDPVMHTGIATGCNNPNTIPVAADVTQIVLSCGGAVLAAVEKGATTYEEILQAVEGSSCGTVTIAEIESIVQLFMGTSTIEGGTLPLDLAQRAQAPGMQAKLKALHHK